jgi:hypothetical protein
MVDVTTRNFRIKIPVEFLVYPEWVGGWVGGGVKQARSKPPA